MIYNILSMEFLLIQHCQKSRRKNGQKRKIFHSKNSKEKKHETKDDFVKSEQIHLTSFNHFSAKLLICVEFVDFQQITTMQRK